MMSHDLHIGDDAKNFASRSADNVGGRMRTFNVDPHREEYMEEVPEEDPEEDLDEDPELDVEVDPAKYEDANARKK